jgi:type I restriction enzyme S subunit
MATNQGFKSFVPFKDTMQAEYLYPWLRHNRTYLEGLGNGATFKEVSKSVVARIEVPVPPIEEQRRIAAILDEADALRAKRRAALVQLDEMAQAIFVEMFGTPRAPKSSNIGFPFGSICQTKLGKMVDQKRQTGLSRKIYLRNANIRWFRFDLSSLLEMDFSLSDQETYKLLPGDVLICEGGEPGRAAVWRGELTDCYFQKALHRARPDTGLVVPEYVVWLLWFLAHEDGLKDHITTSTIAHQTRPCGRISPR